MNVEMESSALFVVARQRGWRAGMVCACSSNLVAGASLYDQGPERAARRLAAEHRGRARDRRQPRPVAPADFRAPRAPCTMRAMAITVTPEVLAKVPLLSGLDRRSLESFSRTLKQRTFRAGQIALDEGESGVGFFIVLDGTATVSIGGRRSGASGPATGSARSRS